MTVNELQKLLIAEIERLAADMSFVNKHGEKAMLKGYPQAIPVERVAFEWDEDEGETDEDAVFPYFIVRVDGVEYQKRDADGANQARVLVAFAVYDEDPGMQGYFTLTAVMERVAGRFQADPALGAFWCEGRMNLAYQEDDTYPHFFGAMEMFWNIPEIDRFPGMEEFL